MYSAYVWFANWYPTSIELWVWYFAYPIASSVMNTLPEPSQCSGCRTQPGSSEVKEVAGIHMEPLPDQDANGVLLIPEHELGYPSWLVKCCTSVK